MLNGDGLYRRWFPAGGSVPEIGFGGLDLNSDVFFRGLRGVFVVAAVPVT